MSIFAKFLKDNVKPESYQFTMGGRFKDTDGEPLVFKIRAEIPLKELDAIETKCKRPAPKGKQATLNNEKFIYEQIKAYSIEPNFSSSDLMKECGVATANDLIDLMFTTGEKLAYIQKCTELTGVGTEAEDLKEAIDEAKN